MVYRIGIVGAGHWSRRLNMGIKDGNSFDIHKTVDVLTYDEKKDLLESLDISRDRHYTIQPGDSLPDDFFDGIDVVQIASPVEYHTEQTLESLRRGKMTITEKSYGADRDEFEEVVGYLNDEDTWDSSYLHLHYLNKLLTIHMPDVVSRAVDEHGPVQRVEATFIEEESVEDSRRSWLFHPRNGGVFLDWIHPIEVLTWACSAEFDPPATFSRLMDAEGYLVNTDYTDDYPTAARAEYAVEGEVFDDGATATVRVGKGFEPGNTHKVMRFVFDDAYIDFKYASSEEEFETDYRGEWVWRREDADGYTTVEEERPKGPIPYEFLIDEVYDVLEGDTTPLDEDLVRRMYEPVWMFNEAVEIDDPVTDADEIKRFLVDALNKTSDKETART